MGNAGARRLHKLDESRLVGSALLQRDAAGEPPAAGAADAAAVPLADELDGQHAEMIADLTGRLVRISGTLNQESTVEEREAAARAAGPVLLQLSHTIKLRLTRHVDAMAEASRAEGDEETATALLQLKARFDPSALLGAAKGIVGGSKAGSLFANLDLGKAGGGDTGVDKRFPHVSADEMTREVGEVQRRAKDGSSTTSMTKRSSSMLGRLAKSLAPSLTDSDSSMRCFSCIYLIQRLMAETSSYDSPAVQQRTAAALARTAHDIHGSGTRGVPISFPMRSAYQTKNLPNNMPDSPMRPALWEPMSANNGWGPLTSDVTAGGGLPRPWVNPWAATVQDDTSMTMDASAPLPPGGPPAAGRKLPGLSPSLWPEMHYSLLQAGARSREDPMYGVPNQAFIDQMQPPAVGPRVPPPVPPRVIGEAGMLNMGPPRTLPPEASMRMLTEEQQRDLNAPLAFMPPDFETGPPMLMDAGAVGKVPIGGTAAPMSPPAPSDFTQTSDVRDIDVPPMFESQAVALLQKRARAAAAREARSLRGVDGIIHDDTLRDGVAAPDGLDQLSGPADGAGKDVIDKRGEVDAVAGEGGKSVRAGTAARVSLPQGEDEVFGDVAETHGRAAFNTPSEDGFSWHPGDRQPGVEPVPQKSGVGGAWSLMGSSKTKMGAKARPSPAPWSQVGPASGGGEVSDIFLPREDPEAGLWESPLASQPLYEGDIFDVAGGRKAVEKKSALGSIGSSLTKMAGKALKSLTGSLNDNSYNGWGGYDSRPSKIKNGHGGYPGGETFLQVGAGARAEAGAGAGARAEAEAGAEAGAGAEQFGMSSLTSMGSSMMGGSGGLGSMMSGLGGTMSQFTLPHSCRSGESLCRQRLRQPSMYALRRKMRRLMQVGRRDRVVSVWQAALGRICAHPSSGQALPPQPDDGEAGIGAFRDRAAYKQMDEVREKEMRGPRPPPRLQSEGLSSRGIVEPQPFRGYVRDASPYGDRPAVGDMADYGLSPVIQKYCGDIHGKLLEIADMYLHGYDLEESCTLVKMCPEKKFNVMGAQEPTKMTARLLEGFES